jgi:hypothetical protein
MSEMKVKLQPFTVPNFIIQDTEAGSRSDGFREKPKHALHEVPINILRDMCEEFTNSVLEKGKPGNRPF